MTATPRWIPLEGAANARDLAGRPASGGVIGPGRLLRSDNLQGLTGPDVRLLVDSWSLRTVVDLRTKVEVDKEGPGPLTQEPAVSIEHLSLFPETGGMTDVDADALLPWQDDAPPRTFTAPGAVGIYLAYLEDRPDSVVAALRAITAAPGAALVHCAAGKDRTGVVVALALSVAGVPRDEIVADYAATGDRLTGLLARLRSSDTYRADVDSRPDDSYRPRARTMERFLDHLDSQFGGPEGWLASAGFSASDAAELRARLVVQE